MLNEYEKRIADQLKARDSKKWWLLLKWSIIGLVIFIIGASIFDANDFRPGGYMRDALGGGFIVLLCLSIYFLPSIAGYNKRNASAIIVLNLFLGWTVIGWVAALVWALTNDPEPPITTQIVNESDQYDKLDKLKKLLDSDAITETEYQDEKAKLLGKEPIKPGSKIDL